MTSPDPTVTEFWSRLLGSSKAQARLLRSGNPEKWQRQIRQGLDGLNSGQRLVLFLEGTGARLSPRGLILLISRAIWSPLIGIESAVHSSGGQVDASYHLWPRASEARIAFGGTRTYAAWATQAGLVGGGKRLWSRWLLQRRSAALVSYHLLASFAIVCSVDESQK